jgi:hypothetical protein
MHILSDEMHFFKNINHFIDNFFGKLLTDF